MIKEKINAYMRKVGFQLTRYPNADLRRRAKIIENLGTDLILDVGANAGQYGKLARELGYKGQIISFEPIRSVFNNLQQTIGKDLKWSSYNYALGDRSYHTDINVSENTYSSSILQIEQTHISAAPDSIATRKETIEVKTLDEVYPSLASVYRCPFLKIDVQGFEKNVLEGGSLTLEKIKGIQLELSLLPLYQNETTLTEMLVYLKEKGFDLVSLENGFSDPETCFLLQTDGLFINRNCINA